MVKSNCDLEAEKSFHSTWTFFSCSCLSLVSWLTAINLIVILVFIVTHRNGDIIGTLNLEDWVELCLKAWGSIHWKLWRYPILLILHLTWSCVSLALIPGQQWTGPFTLSGFQPHYNLNGFKFYLLSMGYMIPIIISFPMVSFYQNLMTLLGYLIVFSFIVSLILLVKGHYCPSPGVFRESGNLWIDFIEGVELYPRVDVSNIIDCKLLLISRFGYLLWQLIIVIAGKVSYELYSNSYQRGQVNVALWVVIILQTAYIMKHFLWEKGFISCVDVTENKFGFAQVFKAMVVIPVIHSLSPVQLIKNDPPMELFNIYHGAILLVLGLTSIGLNYWADLQKTLIRTSSDQYPLFPGQQVKTLQVTYLDEDACSQETVLLVSGLWSLVRHPNYTFELTTALLWSLPGCTINPVNYLYPGYLFLHLINRIHWTQDKCSSKYGKQWDRYCQLVPYRLVPYFY